MKKMVIVSIVFVITSLSHAGMFIEGPETIEWGSTVNMAIISDGPTFPFSGIVTLNPPHNAAGDALSNVILTPEPPYPPIPTYPELPNSFVFDMNYLLGIPEPAIPMVTFDLTNSGTPLGGTITINLLDLIRGTLSTHQLEVVPEPASMLLLGLGAIVLRRRK